MVKFKITQKLMKAVERAIQEKDSDAVCLDRALKGEHLTEQELFDAERFVRVFQLEAQVAVTPAKKSKTLPNLDQIERWM